MKKARTAVRFELKETFLYVLDDLFLDFCLYRFGWTGTARRRHAARRAHVLMPAQSKEIAAT